MSWQKSGGATLWNTTTTRERWPLLLGESQQPQALARADGCAAALSGGSEWLLLSSPASATAAADRSEDGAAAWELSLQCSSLPFRHVAWDLQGMSMAVGAGVIVVSIGWHVHRLRSRRTSDQTVDAVSPAAPLPFFFLPQLSSPPATPGFTVAEYVKLSQCC